jgi:hypothetical protein
MNTFDIGDLVELKATFQDDAGQPTDPTTVTFKIQPAGGQVTTYVYGTDVDVIRDSAGVFRVNWLVTQPWTHEYRWIGTGAVAQEEGGTFYARPRNV